MNIKSYAQHRYANYILIIIVTFCLFIQVKGFDFINFDDGFLLTENPNVSTGLSLDNLKWAFTALDKYHWAPITWITHMIDFQVFGANAAGHHLVNLFYHIVNSLLLHFFLLKTTDKAWQSFFVAILFAVHPLHVESVAWVTARKDLLSTFFMLITLIVYVNYIKEKSAKLYAAMTFLFLMGLMSKSMLITLPILMLFLDYWPLNRISNSDESKIYSWFVLIKEKFPLLVLSFVFTIVVYIAQSKTNAISSINDVSLVSRFGTVVVAYTQYIWKMFWPQKLAVIYPLRISIPTYEVLLSASLILGISIWAYVKGAYYKYLATGWLWYIFSLLPVIGIVQIGYASMADKFTYVPYIGLFIAVVWGYSDIITELQIKPKRMVIATTSVLFVLALIFRSHLYLSCWRNSVTLYNEALSVTENNFLALNNLGSALKQQGDHDGALLYFKRSIEANARFDLGHYNLGSAWLKKGYFDEAAHQFKIVLSLNPRDEKALQKLNFCTYMISLRKASKE